MIVLHGYAAGKGIAIGRARLVVRGSSEVPQYHLHEAEIPNRIGRVYFAAFDVADRCNPITRTY